MLNFMVRSMPNRVNFGTSHACCLDFQLIVLMTHWTNRTRIISNAGVGPHFHEMFDREACVSLWDPTQG